MSCLLHAETDALFLLIYLEHHDLHNITHGDDLGGVLDELVRHLRDVNETVLVYADVYKHAEVDDIAHRAGEYHAGCQILHFQHIGAQNGFGQLVAHVAAGL